MLRIQTITQDPYQKQTVVLSDGSLVTLVLRYVPLQQAWYFDEISWQEFTVNGLRCVTNPNMLRQWKNLIPFGLGCYTDGARDPQLQEDFETETSRLFILTEAEVLEYEDFLADG